MRALFGSAGGLIVLTLLVPSGVAHGGWQTAPNQKTRDSLSTVPRDSHGSAAPHLDLGVSDGESCGPPWVRTGRLSVWSSLLPQYRQRFGWDARWGLLAQHDAGWSGTAVFIYNERQNRLYQEYKLEFVAFAQNEVRLTCSPFYRHRDGSRRVGAMLQFSQTTAAAGHAWLGAYATAEWQTYFGLRDWRPDQWQSGSVARARVGANFDLWQRSHGLLRRLVGSGHFTHAGQEFGADYAYTRASGMLAVRGQSGVVRLDGGWMSSHSPYQNRFDLASEGQFLGFPPGVHTASAFVALRAESWHTLLAGLQAVSFASVAGTSSEPTTRLEGGIGLGLRPDYDDGTGPWKVRLDFPVIASDPHGRTLEYSWAVSIRVWIWPGPMGPVAPADCDYAYSR